MLAQTHLDQLALLFPILFQPANKNPTWSQSRGVGGGEILSVGWWWFRSKATAAVVCLHQVWFCGCGREDLENRGGQQAGLTGRGPLGRGELNVVTVQWTGRVAMCLFWMPIKITIWKRPCFCSVCGEASLLCWMSQVLPLIGTRGEEGPAMNGRAKVPQLVGWGIMLLRLPLCSEGVRPGSW